MKWLTIFGAGLLFALGLGVSGMTQPEKVIAFLDISGNWDPSLMFVMAGAVGINMVLYRITRRRPCPLYSEQFTSPRLRKINVRLISGAAIFGVGWGLSGYCPGPALVSLPSGTTAILVFIASMMSGMVLYRLLLGKHEDRDAEPADTTRPN